MGESKAQFEDEIRAYYALNEEEERLDIGDGVPRVRPFAGANQPAPVSPSRRDPRRWRRIWALLNLAGERGL